MCFATGAVQASQERNCTDRSQNRKKVPNKNTTHDHANYKTARYYNNFTHCKYTLAYANTNRWNRTHDEITHTEQITR